MTGPTEKALRAVEEKLRERLLAGVPRKAKPERPRIVVPISPGTDCITEDQVLAIRACVRQIAELHLVPYQTIWTLLNERMGVSSYRLTPAAEAPQALAFLAHWRDTGLPPAHRNEFTDIPAILVRVAR